MNNQSMNIEKINAATLSAAVFLRSPHATEEARADALDQGAGLLLSAVLQLVRAGREDLAMAAHSLYLKSSA
jgi:hypothetical protein